ncbi:hypothetical protein RUM43_002382 [Polyplax serrata]|uniref:Uncharacterized protein n=1 Tax=Polyplax serrata TaxID=468196 RepID=A0AAN8S4Q1_POLSC
MKFRITWKYVEVHKDLVNVEVIRQSESCPAVWGCFVEKIRKKVQLLTRGAGHQEGGLVNVKAPTRPMDAATWTKASDTLPSDHHFPRYVESFCICPGCFIGQVSMEKQQEQRAKTTPPPPLHDTKSTNPKWSLHPSRHLQGG